MRALNVNSVELCDGQHHLRQLRVIPSFDSEPNLKRKGGREGGRERREYW
jgi:hypothetical protein